MFCAVNLSGLHGEKEVYTGAGGNLAVLSGDGLVDLDGEHLEQLVNFEEEVASYHAGATGRVVVPGLLGTNQESSHGQPPLPEVCMRPDRPVAAFQT